MFRGFPDFESRVFPGRIIFNPRWVGVLFTSACPWSRSPSVHDPEVLVSERCLWGLGRPRDVSKGEVLRLFFPSVLVLTARSV